MSEYILSARQLPCNENNSNNNIRNSGTSVKNGTKIQLCIESDDQLRNRTKKITNRIAAEKYKVPDKYTKTEQCKYLDFSSTQKIIHKLLTRDRIILVPTVVPGVTESDLAKELNITLTQLKSLQKSPAFYKKIAKHINLPLINLYCSSLLQKRSSHIPRNDCKHGGML